MSTDSFGYGITCRFAKHILMITLLLITATTTSAFTPSDFVWSSPTTSYKLDSSYTTYGGAGWVNVANGAASDWNSSPGSFAFSQYSSSQNTIKVGTVSNGTDLAETPTYPGANYRWDDFVTTVNIYGGYSFYDGTQAPSLPANYFDLRSVIRHELGHGLGLCHTWAAPGFLMYKSLNVGQVYPIDQDALNGSNYLYNSNYSYGPPETQCAMKEPVSPTSSGGYDDKPNPVTYGNGNGWQHASGFAKAGGQTVSYTNVTGSRVNLKFTGSRITRRYTMANNRGVANIYIDGALVDSTSDYAAVPRWQTAKTWTVSPGTHSFEVRAAGGGYIDADSFIVDASFGSSGTYDDANTSWIQYIGNWTGSSSFPSAYNGTVHFSNSPEAAAGTSFYGSQVTYVYTKASNRGKAMVTIDGQDYGYIDLYSPSTQWQQATTFSLSPGYHTIFVGVSGLTSGTDTYVDVDRFIVQ